MSETLENQNIQVFTPDNMSGSEETTAPVETNESEKSENSEAQAKEAAEESKDSDIEKTEGEGEADDESDENDKSTDDESDSESESSKSEKKTGVGRRISKLVKESRSAKQEAEYWKRIALEKQEASGKDQDKDSGDARPSIDDFESYEDYQSALIQYNVNKALNPAIEKLTKGSSEKDQQTENEKAHKAFDRKLKAFAKEHGDYKDAIAALEGIEVHGSVEDTIRFSEHGPAILYELGKNPDRAEEIAELPPHLQLKEIGKIEARIEARLEAKKNATPRTTKAPAPPNPVGSKSDGKRSVYDKELSFAEYEKIRMDQMKERASW